LQAIFSAFDVRSVNDVLMCLGSGLSYTATYRCGILAFIQPSVFVEMTIERTGYVRGVIVKP